jgi:ABC-2 type transport system permease protein
LSAIPQASVAATTVQSDEDQLNPSGAFMGRSSTPAQTSFIGSISSKEDARADVGMQEWEFLDMRLPDSVAAQLIAVAELRWRMFVNGLRSRRGKAELVSRIVVTSVFFIGGFGIFSFAIGMSWYLVAQSEAEYLPAVLWPIFLFWQFFPLMATAFTNNPDSSELLRFPFTYRSYFLVRLAYGFFDPASAVGGVGVIGVLLGVTAASPALFPWALVVLLTFAVFNLVLMQMIFAWLERWLAQRRTREVLGVLFILAILSFQLIGPTMERLGHQPHSQIRHAFQIATEVQSVFPPGLAGQAIAEATHGHLLVAWASLLWLGAVTSAIGWLLHLRIRAQFQGENLSEAPARPAVPQAQALRVGWDLPGFSESVAAVFEKETRYLMRSGPMLLTLIMPIFMLVVFRLGPLNPMRHSSVLSRTPDFAFPGAAAYAILVLTNLVYNSFGGDSGGMQFFYASPVQFRQIILGKNLTHAAVLVFNAIVVWFAVTWLYGAPHFTYTVATITGLMFAVPLNFTAGNLLSIYSPKKRDFATFGRQNVSQTTVLASFAMQILIVGVGVAVFALARFYKNLGIAVLLFLILSAISITVYLAVLSRLDRIALERRETLLAELCRA